MSSVDANPITVTAGAFNLLTFVSATSGASISPGTIDITFDGNTYTDLAKNGTLSGSPAGSGTINYATGAVQLTDHSSGSATGTFSYYPGLPVMGLEDFSSTPSTMFYPDLVAFNTTKSFQYNSAALPAQFYNVSYYKSSNNPVSWDGGDYQQFWSTNYSGAMWVTNNVPGFHFVNATYVSGSPGTAITFTFKSGGNPFTTLTVNDVVWFNEFTNPATTINLITGVITNAAGSGTGTYVVTFTNSQTIGAADAGIAEILTNSVPGQDGIRWYDGDPTSGTGLPTGTGLGWVNFAPPLTASVVSIDNKPESKYYLVGALAILPFKDRLLFFSPYIQSSTSATIQLFDTVLWSWNGTPYYTTSDDIPKFPTPSLVPFDQTANPIAYYVDQTGLGNYLPAGIAQPIATISNNEDVLLIGFAANGRKTRFVYTGNDLQPFLFFNINSELPSSSTFSAVALDRGAIDIGNYGIAMTDQQSSQRIDLDIPDSVFQISQANNGAARVSGIRDFFREWIYFSYPTNTSVVGTNVNYFPTQTFLFNYRDNTWAIFYENFTTHGNYRPKTKRSWGTIGLTFPTWNQWREPWNSGYTNVSFPLIIAGNPQGYVLQKDVGTAEAPSGTITAILNSGGLTQITSTNHCVSNATIGVGDYLQIVNCLGVFTPATITAIAIGQTTTITANNTFFVGQFVTISGVVGTTELNGLTFQILSVTPLQFTINAITTNAYASGGIATGDFIGKVIDIIDLNNFIIDIPFPTGSYIGLGQYIRLILPELQTKQFAPYWQEGRQVRIGVQKYLLDYTDNSQITANIYLSQDPDDPWNNPQDQGGLTNSLVYSQIVFTCPESTNLGLTPFNSNLQMPTANGQFQIWHRYSTSLQGDSFQIGLTLNDAQMRNLEYATAEITLHGMQFTIDRGPLLA